MPTYIHAHASVIAQVVVVVVYGLCARMSAMDTSEIEQLLARAVVDALTAAHLSVQEAAFYMDVCERQLRKQLACEDKHHISLTRLIRMPFMFWLHFSPALMALIYKKRLAEFAASVETMKRGA